MYGAPARSNSDNLNLVVNGDFRVAQITSAIGTDVIALGAGAAGQYIERADMWRIFKQAGGALNVTAGIADLNPLSVAQGFSLSVQIPGAVAPGANDWTALQQHIELSRLYPFINLPATLAFWIMSPFSGTHYVTPWAIQANNGGPGGGNGFVIPFTVNLANSWERKALPLDFTLLSAFGGGVLPAAAPAPRGGTQDFLTINFPLLVGANFISSLSNNNWNVLNRFVGNDFQQFQNMATPLRIADVCILHGAQSAFPYLDLAESLGLCERYFWRPNIVSGAYARAPFQYYSRIAGVHNDGLLVNYPAPMRTEPVITFSQPNIPANPNWQNVPGAITSGVAAAEQVSYLSAFLRNPQVIGDAANQQMIINAQFDARY